MAARGFSTTFILDGKEYPLFITPHWQIKPPGETKDRWLFNLYINNYYIGSITKMPSGLWMPHSIEHPENKTNVIVLQAHDFEIIGEMIENNLPDYVK